MDLSAWCLAMAMYNEARGEGRPGQVAVAQVVLNRSESQNKPICLIVYAPNQFQGMHEIQVRDLRMFRSLHLLAKGMLINRPKDATHSATYFHALYIPRPEWFARLQPVTVIGGHVFYVDKNIPGRKSQKVPKAGNEIVYVY